MVALFSTWKPLPEQCWRREIDFADIFATATDSTPRSSVRFLSGRQSTLRQLEAVCDEPAILGIPEHPQVWKKMFVLVNVERKHNQEILFVIQLRIHFLIEGSK